MHPDILPADDVTPEWLTAILASAGIGEGNQIVAIDGTAIGTGQVGENVRFVLSWANPDATLPVTVVGKFPSRSEISRATAALTLTYVREVGFYRDLQPRVSIPVPTVHHVAGNPEANDFILVMEDIANAVQGDQLAGCTVEQAELAIDAAVGLHAPTWGRTAEFAPLDWVDAWDPEKVKGRSDLYAMVFDGFATRYASMMTADDLQLGRELGPRLMDLAMLSAPGETNADDQWCMAHGDYRLDNLLFGSGPGASPITVVDWQTVSIGSGPSDIAYLLGSGLLPPERERHEERLVHRYVDALVAAGIDVSFDGIWHRYVLGSFSGYLMAVTASQIVEQTDRGDAMFVAMASRHAAQMRHLRLLDLLSP